MSALQNHQYLEARVLTAPPHRLHLMLIEGALRYGRQAEQAMLRGDMTTADAPLMRVIDVVGEMLAGVRATKSNLNVQIANFYLYLFRILGQAKVNDDVAKLTEALGLLEFERQTWQLVCDKLGSEPAGTARPTQAAANYAASQSTNVLSLNGDQPTSSLGISLHG
jgi:flagellar secretion chaperone FliS